MGTRGRRGRVVASNSLLCRCVMLVRFLPNLTDLGSDSSCCKNLDRLDSPQHLVDIV